MERKPWPLILIAFFHSFAPLFNILLCSALLKMSFSHYVALMFQNESNLDLISFFFVLPLCGIAIYVTKKWSYPIFLGLFAYNFYINYATYRASPEMVPLWLLLLAYAFNLVIVSYFLLPAVRTTYFNPRVRWWESKPRYYINVPGEFKVGAVKHACTYLNISEGGTFVQAEGNFTPGTLVDLYIPLLTGGRSMKGVIVYRRPGSNAAGGEGGYGVQFFHTPDTMFEAIKMTRAFKLLGLERRPPQGNRLEEFMLWAKTLLSTGKGWKPELPELGQRRTQKK